MKTILLPHIEATPPSPRRIHPPLYGRYLPFYTAQAGQNSGLFPISHLEIRDNDCHIGGQVPLGDDMDIVNLIAIDGNDGLCIRLHVMTGCIPVKQKRKKEAPVRLRGNSRPIGPHRGNLIQVIAVVTKDCLWICQHKTSHFIGENTQLKGSYRPTSLNTLKRNGIQLNSTFELTPCFGSQILMRQL